MDFPEAFDVGHAARAVLRGGQLPLWTVFFGPKPPAVAQVARRDGRGCRRGGTGRPGSPSRRPSPPPTRASPSHPSSHTRSRVSQGASATLSSDGAGLVRGELQGPKMRENEHWDLVEGFQHAFGSKKGGAAQVDLAIPAPGQPPPAGALPWKAIRPCPWPRASVVTEEGPRKVVMTAAAGAWRVTKTFRVALPRDGEVLSLTVGLENTGLQPASGELSLHYDRAVDPSTEEKGSLFGGVGNQWKASCRAGDKTQKLVPNDKPPPEYKGAVEFFGVDQQYFLAAVLPQVDQREGRCVLNATSTQRGATASFALAVAPGQTVTRTYNVFLGPKDSQRLATVMAPQKPGACRWTHWRPLTSTARSSSGLWVAICKVLLTIMKFFYGLFHNWGVAIILLTVPGQTEVLLAPGRTGRWCRPSRCPKAASPRSRRSRRSTRTTASGRTWRR